MSARDVPSSAIIRVPSWFWGGSPAGFYRWAGYRTRSVEGESSAVQRVRPEEHDRKTRPSLISVEQLAGPRLPRPRFERASELAKKPEWASISVEPRPGVERVLARAEADNAAFIDSVNAATLRTTIATPAQLGAEVERIHSGLIAATTQEDPTDHPFADASVYLIRREEQLVRRLRLPAVLMRVEYDPELSRGHVSGIQAAINGGQQAFASSLALTEGSLKLEPYVGPLFAALTPWVWALPAYRALGAVVYTLGRTPLLGTQGEAAELLQVLSLDGPTETGASPKLSRRAAEAAIEWWVNRLNDLLGVLTDPSVFSDAKDTYIASKHIADVATVEQLFRRVRAIQTSHRDRATRMALFFTVLDTLERLNGRKITDLCSLRLAEEALADLRDQVPIDAARILLPAAERAVEALAQVQDGFFILAQSRRSELMLSPPDQSTVSMTREKAAAQYIKVLRNATHGYSGKNHKTPGWANALMAHHSGDLPHDLGLLGYLYLLRLLCNPPALAAKLYRSGHT